MFKPIKGEPISKPKNLLPCLEAALRVIAFNKFDLGTWFGINEETVGS